MAKHGPQASTDNLTTPATVSSCCVFPSHNKPLSVISFRSKLPFQQLPTNLSPVDRPRFLKFIELPSGNRRQLSPTMALDNYFRNKIESMKLEIIKGQAVLRRLEAQRNDYNSRVRLLREELGLLQQPGSYVGEVVKVMGTKKVLVKVHPEGKYGGY